MRIAASRFVGPHDFAAFAASRGSEDDDEERSTVREIYASELARSDNGEELVYTVRGRSFMRFMVRKMVGTLLDVGRGKLVPDDIPPPLSTSRPLQVRTNRPSARPVHGASDARRSLARR